VPTLNQKAREVPVKYPSLNTTGLFILLTKWKTFFWIGTEYYSTYLDETTYTKQSQLISNVLYDKLQLIYQSACDDSVIESQKMIISIEGKEEKSFFKVLETGQSEEYEVG
jgi:hypothetical protein